MSPLCNIAAHLPRQAERAPFQCAVVVPGGRLPDLEPLWAQWTFHQLDEASDHLAHCLTQIGITRGKRTVLMVTPSLDYFSLVFALFKVGAVMVLIDPGLPRQSVLQCLKECEVEAFVGVPLAHVARTLFPGSFRKVEVNLTVGRRWFWGGYTLEDLKAFPYQGKFPIAPTTEEDLAAILFTSGSTGVPKGAVYTHGHFEAQVRLLRENWDIKPGGVDLCTFPLFALFDPALGLTAVVPEMDFRKPAQADPRLLVEAIKTFGATQLFGSPALIDTLSRYGTDHGVTLPSIRRVLSSGAPMTPQVLQRMVDMVPNAEVYTPYGATESLPVAKIEAQEMLAETVPLTQRGEGICVGRPVSEITVRIIKITDDMIPQWSDDLLVAQGEIGEITVAGPVVTEQYWARPELTRLAKIQEGDHVVHRMGDVGKIDEKGRIWMCGRKSHRVETEAGPLFSVPVEEVFNTHPQVRRTALVWRGERPRQKPVLVVELEQGINTPETEIRSALLALGARYPHTAGIQDVLFYPEPFPVDIRHNAKITREKLAEWAATRLGS